MNWFAGRPTSLREVAGSAIGGAIVGGTGGAASELALPVQLAVAGSSGVVGGIAERGIKTGSLNKATDDPGEMAKDFVTTLIGHGTGKVTEALATTSERGAVRTITGQIERASAPSKIKKLTGRLQDAQKVLTEKQKGAGAAGGPLRI